MRHVRTPEQKGKKIQAYRPQTNGKVERFHRILLEEWAYIRDWNSEPERHHAYTGFIHFYNHHRSHGALKWATPASILEDNLPPRRPQLASNSPSERALASERRGPNGTLLEP